MAFADETGKADAILIRRGPRAVGHFTADLAAAAFNKKGPEIATLLADWSTIAGAALAGCTLPEKLTKAAPDARSLQSAQNDKRPAHLVLKVAPAKALEVQYMLPQLIERINQALGYRAISAIRLMQAPIKFLPAKPPKKRLTITVPEGASRLDIALARLAAGLKSRD